MRNQRKFVIFALLTLLWYGFIITRSLKTADESTEESGLVLDFLYQFLPFLTMYMVRKAAHFTGFAILGALASLTCLQLKKPNPIYSAMLCLLAALGDETVQLSIPGRSGQVTDVWIDFAGAMTAMLLIFTTAMLRKKRNNQNEE